MKIKNRIIYKTGVASVYEQIWAIVGHRDRVASVHEHNLDKCWS